MSFSALEHGNNGCFMASRLMRGPYLSWSFVVAGIVQLPVCWWTWVLLWISLRCRRIPHIRYAFLFLNLVILILIDLIQLRFVLCAILLPLYPNILIDHIVLGFPSLCDVLFIRILVDLNLNLVVALVCFTSTIISLWLGSDVWHHTLCWLH